jgi:lipoate-protein ligase A
MAKEWRLIKMEPETHADAMFASAAIERAINEGISPSTVLLSKPEKDCITIGYFQDPEKDVNLDYCREQGFVLMRRTTAGGTIFTSKDIVVKFLHFAKSEPEVPIDDLDRAYRQLLPPIAKRASEHFGIDVVYKPINDMTIGGKKAYMSNFIYRGNILYFQGGFQRISVPKEQAAKAIPVAPEKMKDRAAATVEEWITDLGTEIKREPSFEEVWPLYLETIEKAYKVKLIEGELSAKEKEYSEGAKKQLMSDDWYYARAESRKFGTIPPDVKRAEFRVKAVSGLIRAVTLTKEDIIQNISITGDFSASPITIIDEMEDALKGVKADEKVVREKIEGIFNKPGVSIPLATPDDFATAVMGAVKS